MMEIEIKRMVKEQIPQVATVASNCFGGLRDINVAKKWIECNFNAFPRMQYFVAHLEDKIVGYILWMEKGGFRQESVMELEQIGVHPDFRGRGVGTKLVTESFKEIKNYLKERGSKLKLIEITTGTENEAQRLYRKTLKAKPECKIKDLFRGDEVIMIAREGENENQ